LSNFLTRKKVILTPLIAISFVLSLSWVNFRDRSYRVAEHPLESGSSRWWSWATVRRLVDPEPYADGGSEEWIQLTETTNGSPGSVAHGSKIKFKEHDGQRWFIRKKYRAMTRMELSDAWEMKRAIMIALLICVCMLGGLVVYGFLRAWNWRNKL
jgi:hypothetical protein